MFSRRLSTALFLILALLVGQQAVALHNLSHAAEQIGNKQPGSPPKHSCDQCFLGAQLSGAMGAHVSIPPVVLAGGIDALLPSAQFVLAAARLSFRSRAPPTLL